MTKHVHADLMAEYAKDAQKTDNPWLLWEYKGPESGCWQSCKNSPTWWGHFEYRHKRKTHIVNGKEVAAPLDKVEENQEIHIIDGVYVDGVRTTRVFIPLNWKPCLLRGTVFATKEDAQENFNAHFPIRNI